MVLLGRRRESAASGPTRLVRRRLDCRHLGTAYVSVSLHFRIPAALGYHFLLLAFRDHVKVWRSNKFRGADLLPTRSDDIVMFHGGTYCGDVPDPRRQIMKMITSG